MREILFRTPGTGASGTCQWQVPFRVLAPPTLTVMKPWVSLAGVLLLAACTTSVFDLDVGDCLTDPGSGQIESVDVVDCTGEHSFEVYANLTVPDDIGLAGIAEFALDGCYSAFAEYVGTDFESSAFDFTWLEPTAESWEQSGDRTVNCLLFDFQGATSTGSARGSAR